MVDLNQPINTTPYCNNEDIDDSAVLFIPTYYNESKECINLINADMSKNIVFQQRD